MKATKFDWKGFGQGMGILSIFILIAFSFAFYYGEETVSAESPIIPTCCELKQEYKYEQVKVVYAEEAQPIRSMPFEDKQEQKP